MNKNIASCAWMNHCNWFIWKRGITSDRNITSNCHLLTRMGQNSFPWLHLSLPWPVYFHLSPVGGGTGGSIVASRLAMTGASVLLLEAGPSAPPETIIPSFTPILIGGGPRLVLFTAVSEVRSDGVLQKCKKGWKDLPKIEKSRIADCVLLS